jgi:tetrahydrodipicolinate N-succinyltransferase
VAADLRGVLVGGLVMDGAAVDAGGEGEPPGSVVVAVGEQVWGGAPVESAEAARVRLRLLVVVGVFAEEGLQLQVRPGEVEQESLGRSAEQRGRL